MKKPVIVVNERLKGIFESRCEECVRQGYKLRSTASIIHEDDHIYPPTEYVAVFVDPNIEEDEGEEE